MASNVADAGVAVTPMMPGSLLSLTTEISLRVNDALTPLMFVAGATMVTRCPPARSAWYNARMPGA